VFAFEYNVPDVKRAGYAGQDPENTQGQFAEFTAKLKTKGHARVLGEMDHTPVGKPAHFTQGIIEFDVDFDELVGEQHQQNCNEWDSITLEHLKIGYCILILPFIKKLVFLCI